VSGPCGPRVFADVYAEAGLSLLKDARKVAGHEYVPRRTRCSSGGHACNTSQRSPVLYDGCALWRFPDLRAVPTTRVMRRTSRAAGEARRCSRDRTPPVTGDLRGVAASDRATLGRILPRSVAAAAATPPKISCYGRGLSRLQRRASAAARARCRITLVVGHPHEDQGNATTPHPS